MGQTKFWTGVLLAMVLIAGGCASKKKAEMTPPPGMTHEQMAAMEKMMKPGAEHAALAKYEGCFTAHVEMWMDPSGAPTTSKGRQSNRMVYGGRYLQGSFEGAWMGQGFKGVSITGFDNGEKKYFTTWMDDMSTALMYSKGEADASGNVITFTSDMFCGMTNAIQPTREVLTLIDTNNYTLEMYMTVNGKENKMMKITYTRSKWDAWMPWK